MWKEQIQEILFWGTNRETNLTLNDNNDIQFYYVSGGSPDDYFYKVLLCLVFIYHYTVTLMFRNSRIPQKLSCVFIRVSADSERRQQQVNQNAVSLAMQALYSFVCSIYEATCRTDN